jgi:hypothetical protein
MARRECAMAALFPAERIGGLASLQPATLRLAADVRYGGHSRRSDGQQGFADVRYAFNGDRICASQQTDANGMDRPCSRPEPLRG